MRIASATARTRCHALDSAGAIASRASASLFAFFWLTVCCLGAAWADEVKTTRLDHAMVVRSNAAEFPASLVGRETTLPDETPTSPSKIAGPTWYRLHFDGSETLPSEAPAALYIERACGVVEVLVNGRSLFESPAASVRDCYHPLLFALPRGLPGPNANTIDVKLAGEPLAKVAVRERAAGLSAVHVGDYDTLALAQKRDEFWLALPGEVRGVGLLLAGIYTFVVGWLTTRRGYLLHLSLLAVAASLLSANAWLQHLAIAPPPAILLSPVIAAFSVLFLMRYAGLRLRALDAALLAQCLIVPASLALAGDGRIFLLARSWNFLLSIEVMVAAVAALRLAWPKHRREFWIMSGLLFVIALSVAGELTWQQGWLAASPPASLRLALPAAFVALGMRMLYIEVNGLRSVESEMRALIERRIAEASAEAERNFATLAELRVEQVTERERKRIAADLHDDLGAKLLTIVHTSESDRISTLAREALEEMRLSVRGLTGKPVRLADALGDWRAEVVSRLAQANIGAEWRMPGEEPPQTLPARAYVQTTRILREAVSNIIKHSGAARCIVSGAVQDGDFLLMIQDNGHGIPMELDGNLDRGHGMASMKQRAKQLQGQCLVESGPGFGTVIRLTIPL